MVKTHVYIYSIYILLDISKNYLEMGHEYDVIYEGISIRYCVISPYL
jgi:hypothetical protein